MSEGELYAAIAELWCSPRDVDPQVRCQARQLAESWPDAEGGELLRRFLDSPVSEEEYIDLFELAPRCPLYLGSHVFEEPVTCARAAVSDRNGYMLELMGIY
ncbi:MAG TPA: hypothetical protein VNO81_08475, partial [Candidatus Nitrosotenuis sp.]|nr:hypothetical protein [Candidatus Nitrosotenuis sp.]